MFNFKYPFCKIDLNSGYSNKENDKHWLMINSWIVLANSAEKKINEKNLGTKLIFNSIINYKIYLPCVVLFLDSILYTFFFCTDKLSYNVNCTFDSFDSFVKLLVSNWI